MSGLVMDIRQALRSFAKSRGLVVVAVLTIALGVGASSAMFSIVQSVLLNPLPYHEPDRLVSLWPEKRWSANMLNDVRERVQSYEAVSIYSVQTYTLLSDGPSEAIPAGVVSASHFDVLGLRPAIGGGFVADDALAQRGAVVMLSHDLWQRQFGGDPRVIGQQIRLAGNGLVERTVVGVLPADAETLPSMPAAWVPIVETAGQPGSLGFYGLDAIGRLKPGVSIEQARHELRGLVEELTPMHASQFRSVRYSPVDVVSLLEQQVREVRGQLWLLLGAAAFILLIACANVANLLLARAQGRQGEVALRLALGGSRRRVMRQVLSESLLLSTAGGLLGIWATYATLPLLRELVADQVPRGGSISVDATVMLFALGVIVLAGLASGLIPAVRAANAQPAVLMRAGGGRGQAGTKGSGRASQALVIGEIALCLVLLTGAGLMIKSTWQLMAVDPGFDANNVLTVQFTVPPERFDETEVRDVLRRQIEESVAAIPGIEAVASVDYLPLGGAGAGIPYLIEGVDFEGDTTRIVNLRTVTPDYFELMRVPLLEGRMLGPEDIPVEEGGSALVNETFARQYWPEGGAVGRRLLNSEGELMATIVGVVRDERQRRLSEPAAPEIFGSAVQFGWPTNVALLARGVNNLPSGETVTRAIQRAEPDIAPRQVRALTDIVAASMDDTRFYARLLATFAIAALALGVVGVYGVISYAVSRQTRELGVRQALGATAGNLVAFVLRRAMMPVFIGVALGLVAALLVVRLLASLIYGVGLADPSVFGGVALMLVFTGVCAALIPAVGATRVSPVEALRPD